MDRPVSRVQYLDELLAPQAASQTTYAARRAEVWDHVNTDYPVNLGAITAVTYNDKTDRYVAKHNGGTVKVSTEVAEMLLTHANIGSIYGPCPTVHARIEKGEIVSVLILFLSKPERS